MAKDVLKLRPKEQLVIILDDLDFSFFQKEIDSVIYLYNQGFTIKEIASIVKPTARRKGRVEILLLIIHLLRNKTIEERKEGILEI